jgi:peroxiredoxin
MVSVSSTMLALGTPAPDFALPDLTGQLRRLNDFADAKALVVAFLSNHCPYVRHIAATLGEVATELAGRGVAVVGIASNDTDAYPDDRPERMAQLAAESGWRFPCLIDADQQVAKAFRAACTPDFYIFDRERRLAYRGQFDDSRPANTMAVTGGDLLAAATEVCNGEKVSASQRPSLGCNIKWRPGNAPDYF